MLTIAAVSQVNLTRDVLGLLPVANGGTGVATASANYIFAGPLSGAAAAPSFKTFASAMGAVPLPNTRRWTLVQATGSTTLGTGDIFTQGGTIANAAASATAPSVTQFTTTTTNANVASETGNLNYVVGRTLYRQDYRILSTTTTRRDWWGLSDQTVATMGAADDPAGNYAAFLYSSVVGANFMCVTKDNATQSSVSSGVAADTSLHYFEILENPGVSFLFYIDGVLVRTAIVNLPTTATPLRYVSTVTCVVCTPTTQNFKRAWMYIESNF